MRSIFGLLVLALAAGLITPFYGPQLGLDGFRDAVFEPGQSVKVPAGTLNVYLDRPADPEPKRDVILIHGQPGSADMMRPLGRALAALGYRAIRYDRMGWGYSSQRAEDDPANPTAHARDLLHLMEELELDDPVVVGYSYGGGVAMEANRLSPQEVSPLVLVSSVGDKQVRNSSRERLMTSQPVMRWVFGTTLTANLVSGALISPLQAPETIAPDEVEALMASLAMDHISAVWTREQDERYLGFKHYQPEAVAACTLVLHGTGDAVVAPSTAEYVASQINDAKLMKLSDTGHGVVLTQPERLAGLISQHIRSCDG